MVPATTSPNPPQQTHEPPSPSRTTYIKGTNVTTQDFEGGCLVRIRIDGVQCDMIDHPVLSCVIQVDQGAKYTTGYRKNHPSSPTSAGQWDIVAIPVSLAQCGQGIVTIELWHHQHNLPDECIGLCQISISDLRVVDLVATEQKPEWVALRTPTKGLIKETVDQGGDAACALLLVSSSLVISKTVGDRLATTKSFARLVHEAEVGEHHHAPARPEEAGLPSVLDVIPHKANNLNTNNNPKRASSAKCFRRHSTPDSGQEMSEFRCSRSLEAINNGKVQIEEATRKLKATLMAIEGRVLASQPMEGRRAIDLEWVYKELVNVLTSLDSTAQDSDLWRLQDTLNFRTLVKYIDLKESDKEWLTTEYTREVLTETLTSSDLNVTIARRVSSTQLRKTQTSSENLAIQDDCHGAAEYYYKDKEGRKHGPHTVRELLAWYYGGKLDEKILVKKGIEGHFQPISTYLDTWKTYSKEMVILADLNAIESKINVPDDPTKYYKSWGFDVLALEPREIYPFCWTLFKEMQLPDIFDIEPTTFWNLMSTIEHYMTRHGNPYHNFYHAADVCHACFMFLHCMEGSKLVNELEVMACMVAALCHDLDHPGTNNVYQVNRQTPLGLLYNDQSVLENHHAATAFKILSKPECNIVAKMSPPEHRQFRRLMISMILATDMSYHFKLKDLFDGCVVRSIRKAGETDTLPVSLLGDEDRDIFLKTILHTADLCNPAKPWGVSKMWSDKVADEFFNQGDREKLEGLPISPNMNRDTTDRAELALNFNDFIVAPAYVALASLLPLGKQCVVCTIANRARWEDIHTQRLLGQAMEEEKRKEELCKWNKRKVAFEKIVGAEILAELDDSSGNPKSRDRRKSLRVLHDLVAATHADEEKKDHPLGQLPEDGDRDELLSPDESEDEDLVPEHLRVKSPKSTSPTPAQHS